MFNHIARSMLPLCVFPSETLYGNFVIGSKDKMFISVGVLASFSNKINLLKNVVSE